MHVFSDLQPYICTFTDCEYELVQFSSRAAWAEHEFSKHRNTRLWTCPECPQEFCEVSDWEQHLQERHCLFFSGTNLQVAKNMALKTEAKCTENDECPLCRIVVGKPRRGFVKHVGRHMEEIALKALPPNVEDDTEEGSSSSEHTSLENAVDISAFRQNHIAQGITSETLPEEDKRHIDAKMQSMGHSITPRLSPSRSKDQGQRPFDSKFNESGYIQHCLDERHDLRDNYVDMSDGGNDDQATSSSNDIQSLHSFNYPWQAEAPDPNKPEIEHLERDPPPGVQFARPSYQSSAPMGRGQVNDPSAPLYQITSDVFQGATTEADSDGKFNSRHICNDCNRTFKGWGELRRHAKKHQPDSKLFHCVAADCACSSYRKDKLEDHVRRHHPNLDVVAKTPQSLAHEAPTFQISDAEKELENDFGDSDGTFGGPHPADTNTLKGSGGFTAPNLTKKHLGREPPPE